ncbi:Gfo/Idh/MocA family protein [Lacticaseibacillus sp. GG6-2]
MTINIGVIGTGAMGRAHIQRLQQRLNGGEVIGVMDIDQAAATKARDELAPDARVYADEATLLADPAIQAVFIVSAGFAHAATIQQALAQDKMIFTEKPLATTADTARAVIEAEQQLSGRRIQVGFMRRYDPAIRALKAQLDSGVIGQPLAVLAAHINLEQAPSYTNEMAVTDTLIHEIDEMHWLLNDDYQAVRIEYGRQSTQPVNPTLHDPQLVTLLTQRGVPIQVLVHLTATYGYEVRTQVIGEIGELWLPLDGVAPETRHAAQVARGVEVNWAHRFETAYDLEVQAFLDDLNAGRPLRGPSSWDGYIAATVADVAIRSQTSHQLEPITLPVRPAFYQEMEG